MIIPQDPIILCSLINTRLRDQYESLDELCASMMLDKDELVAKLAAAGFRYDAPTNQFR